MDDDCHSRCRVVEISRESRSTGWLGRRGCLDSFHDTLGRAALPAIPLRLVTPLKLGSCGGGGGGAAASSQACALRGGESLNKYASLIQQVTRPCSSAAAAAAASSVCATVRRCRLLRQMLLVALAVVVVVDAGGADIAKLSIREYQHTTLLMKQPPLAD